MHPSSYSRLGRRRKNRGNQPNVDSDDERTALKPDSHWPNHLRRSSSGPDLAVNHYVNHCRRASNPNISNAEMNQPKPNPTCDSSGRLTGKLCSYEQCETRMPVPVNEQQVEEVGQDCVNGRIRHRSGSWTGVNESDDDMAYITRNNPQPSIRHENGQSFDNSITSSTCPDIPVYGPSYQDSYSTYTSENTIPPDHQCTNEEAIKRRLKFFFMNPIEKWHAKKRLPWKLLIQIVKILICTSQLCMFASQRYSHVTYLWDTKVTFSHLFIKGWDTSREITAYPPSTGPLAIYQIHDFYEFLDYSVTAFSTVEKTAVGSYKYDRKGKDVVMPIFCFSEFDHGMSDLDNLTFIFNNTIRKVCIDIPYSVLNSTSKWSTKEYLSAHNLSINFDILLDASYSFKLKTLKLRSDFPFETPECYRLESLIYYDNSDHDGQMLVELDVGAKVLECKGAVDAVSSDDAYMRSLRSILNLLTISICLLSFGMCLRTLYRAQSLKRVVNSHFRIRFHRDLDSWEKFEFVNLWYVLICVNDFLIIIGSIIKMGLESQDYEGYLDKWNACSLLLGTGNLLIWFGCLRYLGFFETYNVLILTIKRCFPNVLRYSICILMVFAGYSFCGWLILGPYHFKFRSLSSTTECLYSLINGDDMFATFSSTIGKDAIVWWFSRIYLYTFISLFIYVILSLFIAIITDAYDTIKRYYEEGFPQSELMAFANECRADPWSGVFHDGETTIQDIVNHICCCCRGLRNRHTSPSEYEPILT